MYFFSLGLICILGLIAQSFSSRGCIAYPVDRLKKAVACPAQEKRKATWRRGGAQAAARPPVGPCACRGLLEGVGAATMGPGVCPPA